MHKKCKRRLCSMTEKAAAARREYKRKWQQENRDKVRAQQERYWERKAAQAEKAQQEPQDSPQRA